MTTTTDAPADEGCARATGSGARRFACLTHARKIRDEAAETCLPYLAGICETSAVADRIMEMVCCAGEGWHAEITSWPDAFMQSWDSYDWPPLHAIQTLNEAVQFIRDAEHAATQHQNKEVSE